MKPGSKPYTHSDEQVIRDEWARGMPASEIAKMIGRTSSAILAKAKYMRLPQRNKTAPLASSGATRTSGLLGVTTIGKKPYVGETPVNAHKGECLWADGHSGAFVVCTEKATHGCFCEAHGVVGYRQRDCGKAA